MLGLLMKRLQGKCRRTLSSVMYQRTVKMQNAGPLISFTFDDFPQSALEIGGDILLRHGVAGTYYVSLGLLDQESPAGRICSAEHVVEALEQGHELGCHTFHHCDAWETDSHTFDESILANGAALKQIVPEAKFLTLSYPISTPRPSTKRGMGRHFAGCRGGGQGLNAMKLDLNYFRAFFLERAKNSPDAIWEIINRNRMESGWLIFATHDVSLQPTQYGCTPDFFKEVLKRSIDSGATILPVAKALPIVCGQIKPSKKTLGIEQDSSSS